MTLNELQNKLNGMKRGRYFAITYKHTYGEYAKTTRAVVRLADYYKVTGKEPKLDTNKVSNDKHLGNNLIYNSNTGKTRLQVFLTNNPNHKPHSVYEYQGNEISKDEFYGNVNKKPSNISVMFTIDVESILAIG